MTELCKHETFKDICEVCHRDAIIALLAVDNERLRAALEGLLRCPAIADGNHNEPAWACPETIEAERIARRALGGDNG